MAIKEHPFVITTTLKGDGVTINYDAAKPNRSTAVGLAYKINSDGKAELVAAGDEIHGKVVSVDSDNNITGAYMFGGLRLPIGSNKTVKKGDKLVGALGKSSAKGYVAGVPVPSDLPSDIADVDGSSIADDTKRAEAITAAGTHANSISSTVSGVLTALKGQGTVIDFDATHALVAFP